LEKPCEDFKPHVLEQLDTTASPQNPKHIVKFTLTTQRRDRASRNPHPAWTLHTLLLHNWKGHVAHESGTELSPRTASVEQG